MRRPDPADPGPVSAAIQHCSGASRGHRRRALGPAPAVQVGVRVSTPAPSRSRPGLRVAGLGAAAVPRRSRWRLARGALTTRAALRLPTETAAGERRVAVQVQGPGPACRRASRRSRSPGAGLSSASARRTRVALRLAAARGHGSADAASSSPTCTTRASSRRPAAAWPRRRRHDPFERPHLSLPAGQSPRPWHGVHPGVTWRRPSGAPSSSPRRAPPRRPPPPAATSSKKGSCYRGR